jgi:hypothetical protein
LPKLVRRFRDGAMLVGEIFGRLSSGVLRSIRNAPPFVFGIATVVVAMIYL